MSLVNDLKPVVSCGWLAPPTNGKKEGTRYVLGAEVKLSCDRGYVLRGSEKRTCLETGQWSGEITICKTGVVEWRNKVKAEIRATRDLLLLSFK
ncbi:hypothetical protein DPEC_G00371450 [Dallia pectoralis]|nr:hypothetical protein DPEC_G00371450 [Dallia pectoralis]